MATSWLTNIQMNQNQLLQPVIHSASTAPTSPAPVAGQMYYNTTSHLMFYYNGTAWVEADALNVTNAGVSAVNLNALAAPTANIPMGGYTFTGLVDPTTAQMAATKNYVDSVAQGISWKSEVAAATTTAMTPGTAVYASVGGGVGDTLTAGSNGALGTVDGVTLWTSLSQVISAVSGASTTITATVTSNAGMAVGQPITIAGAAGGTWANINGNWIVASLISTTQFTFVVTTASTGTYTASTATASAAAARVLVKNETATANNGIYTVTSLGAAGSKWVFTRSTDMDAPTAPDTGISKYDGACVFVQTWNGISNTNGATAWQCVPSTENVVPGTTAITFSQFASATAYTADETTIHLAANQFSIKSTYPGQSSLVTVGTITTGVWNGTTIAIANGGTGAITAAGARAAGALSSTSFSLPQQVQFTSQSTTGGTQLSLLHSLNNSNPEVAVYQSGAQVYCDVAVIDANHIGITTAANQSGLSVIVVG